MSPDSRCYVFFPADMIRSSQKGGHYDGNGKGNPPPEKQPGITQEALAEALNVTAQTVSKWERGTSMPDVQMLPEIAVYFGVTIDQLFAMAPAQ